MTDVETRRVRVLLADRAELAALDAATLTDVQRTALVRGLRARGRLSDARRIEGAR